MLRRADFLLRETVAGKALRFCVKQSEFMFPVTVTE